MRLLLIEDEPDSLMGMHNAVTAINLDFTVSTANHAEKALEIITAERPDLIVTDIMLPGMTGLDLIETLKSIDYQPKVIVVSGYNDFEYARRSIRVGAVDYLLKPFSTEEFIEKVEKVLLLIQEERKHDIQFKQQTTYAEIGNRTMRDSYLIDFCLKRTPLEEHLYQRLSLWEMEWLANESYCVIILDAKGYPDGKPLGQDSSLQTFAIGNIVQELITDHTSSILFIDPKNRWVILTKELEVDVLSRRIIDEVKTYQKIQLALGVSSKRVVFEDICAAYHEALKAFVIHSLSNENGFSSMSDHHHIMATTESSWAPAEMSSFICEKEKLLIETGVSGFIRQTLLFDGTEGREDIIRHIMNYLAQVHLALSEIRSEEIQEIPMRVWEKLDECRTIQEYEAVVSAYFIALSTEMPPLKIGNALIERAMKIIATRYSEELSLQLIAEQLEIHPVWLSQLFKKETGHTYMDFLTDLRIERAKTHLRETNLKIYEIAERVGYHDLQHFGNKFKQRTGQTPKEYRYGK
ncbi:hypothetical protein SD71_15705 [Cohnella kolymensis]|uniref:AraC family transcriptional regulator n=1 Tax=Cohnella kolymensis TaxID=1590652 RepID=A0ABR5A327_9BACL|nr:response regulator [Cohnella kolymensis]KIL35093.1 hypothetical protein SD71_15705 [Cohnella kolymensis]